MGILPEQAGTFKEFVLLLEGYNLREREEWERTRWQTTVLVNVQLPKGKKVRPIDLLRFEWDVKGDGLTYKERKARALEMREKWGRYD